MAAADPLASATDSVREKPLEKRPLRVRRIGRIDYPASLELQRELVEARRANAISDTLLLVEHPPVITLGARNRVSTSHIVASETQLREQSVTVHETGRGGDVTYHGPGQLVGYPILDLRPDRCDVHRYVRDLEEVLILALHRFGVVGRRLQGLSGVWVGDTGREEKIAAIGVRISRWITSHGFALNISTDLDHFRLIVPCGIADRGVTSIDRITGRQVSRHDVEDAVIDAFGVVFGRVPVGGM